MLRSTASSRARALSFHGHLQRRKRRPFSPRSFARKTGSSCLIYQKCEPCAGPGVGHGPKLAQRPCSKYQPRGWVGWGFRGGRWTPAGNRPVLKFSGQDVTSSPLLRAGGGRSTSLPALQFPGAVFSIASQQPRLAPPRRPLILVCHLVAIAVAIAVAVVVAVAAGSMMVVVIVGVKPSSSR